MQDYSNIWKSYMDFWQRSWLDMSRLWFPALPGMTGANKPPGAKPGKEEALSPFPVISPENWMAMFTPWMPKVEANIEPMMEEAARFSMRVFMPWQPDPFWVEGMVAKEEKKPGKALGNKATGEKAIEDATETPKELEVKNAIKRSRSQD